MAYVSRPIILIGMGLLLYSAFGDLEGVAETGDQQGMMAFAAVMVLLGVVLEIATGMWRGGE